jgi:penicillin-binding protein 2
MDRYTLSLTSRERIAQIAMLGALALILVWLFKLQVIDHRELADLADKNRIRVVPIEPQRGLMYDRDGRIIVGNRPSYTVSVVPSEEVKGKTIPNISHLIGFDTSEVRNRIRRNLSSPFQPADVKRDIPFDVIAVLEEQNTEYPGVNYQLDQVRQYGVELGTESFTGYVGEVSDAEMARGPAGFYRLGSVIGKKGLEKQYDQVLRGIEGTKYIEVSALGEVLGPYEGRQRVSPTAGSDLLLSIDNDVQRVAVAELDSFCCGAIVALDPTNGEVLAMTSDPGFDANVFSSVVSDSLWQAIASDSTFPLLNRPLNGVYPPGSTAKLLTLGAGLQEGLIDANSTFRACNGGYQFGNRYFKCWDRGGHGALTAVHAVEASCDVYFYQLGLKEGVDLMSRYYDLCGFGKPTGIDLPNESSGLNPNSNYYDRRYGKNGWTRALCLNNAIGQGEILVTPLQLAQFYAGIANWGTVYRPHLVRGVKTPEGEVSMVQPRVSFKLPFSTENLAIMREGLRLVVEGPHGTARRLKNTHYTVAGKTGTAQNPHGKDHSWFVGYAPIENPQIVVCAIVENAGHGSEVAAPVVGKVIEAYMYKKLGLKLGPYAQKPDSTTAARP